MNFVVLIGKRQIKWHDAIEDDIWKAKDPVAGFAKFK